MRSTKIRKLTLAAFAVALLVLPAIAMAQAGGSARSGNRMGNSRTAGFDPRDGATGSGVKRVTRPGFEVLGQILVSQNDDVIKVRYRALPDAAEDALTGVSESKAAAFEPDDAKAEVAGDFYMRLDDGAKKKRKMKLLLWHGETSSECKLKQVLYGSTGSARAQIFFNPKKKTFYCDPSVWAN